MPVPAAALADVVVGDDHPTVALGRGDHPLDEAAVRLLGLGPPRELGAGVAKPQRQGVAEPLELADREHPRAAERTDAPFDPPAREGGAEHVPELALDPADLAAQVGARAALGGLGRRRRGERRRSVGQLVDSVSRGGHEGLLTRGRQVDSRAGAGRERAS
jgi:hypothetical protein